MLVDGLIYLVPTAAWPHASKPSRARRSGAHASAANFPLPSSPPRDRIYFCDEQGKTTVIKTGRQYQELATNTLDDGCKASPAAVGNALILRTKTSLYRIEEN